MFDRLYEYLAELSRLYGTGDTTSDVVGFTLVISFLALMIGLISYRRERSSSNVAQSIERIQSMGGKLEKIERTINEFRTEMLRNAEISKGSIEFAKEQLVEIRDVLYELAGRGGGTPSSGSGGGVIGGPGAGSGGGTLGVAGSSGSAQPVRVDSGTNEISEQEVQSLLKEIEEDHPQKKNLIAEPPQTEEKGIFSRLRRSRETMLSKVRGFFSGKTELDQSMIDQLEELLLTSDIGVKTSLAIIQSVQRELASGGKVDQEALYETLKKHLLAVLAPGGANQGEVTPVKVEDGPFVVMLVGVNGAGKTTTVAKLAHQWREEGKSVMVAAADTFRAAAVDQLKEWAGRVNVPIITGAMGAKPATVVYDAMVAAKREAVDVLIIDTAGRLQNKANLMQELEGIRNVMSKHQTSAPHEVLLVVDGSSGQNALVQAQEFNAAASLTGVIITKLDGTPKGGMVVAIKSELGIPVRYIGVGEKKEDLKVFDAEEFVTALVGTGGGEFSEFSLGAAIDIDYDPSRSTLIN